ncbi:Bicarbonate transport ATP-binding protein CmpD [Anatilimnocola aggregata]|uniref:Bicarbonate transport ATP-binding protein CmpD n=1 Tax=Anatilimnocola aggregata TaxID=2528021 RepID=A0A517Y689_9BACT|nr:ABC transporter ATP-binding protein [Anatilimnocola aggregata]QDU25745.1 Bicarbonate transport ATP-binding protein CmpD [Anatilimnocola aggregata]
MAGYVELFRVGKSYPSHNGPAVIVRDISLNIDQGEFIALIGHSGCGKSTVLSMVAGLSECSTGAIVVANREIDGPGPDRGVVFQSPCLLPWLTALENVQIGVDRVYPHVSRAQRREIAAYHLQLVGLGDSLERKAAELSQGMQQRVGIARAFAISPKMLLLDEPFGMLDSLTRMELQEVLADLLARDRKTSLMVTHDVDEALLMADRIVMMTSGPAATIGEIVTVPFARPRNRTEVLNHPDYYPLRERLIGFLENQGHHPPATEVETKAEEATPANVLRIDAADQETQAPLTENARLVRRA